MSRIFLTLASISTILLLVALYLGLDIGDPRSRDPEVQQRVVLHFLTGVSALVFAVLVHAIVLTYFMGTGRWLEETSNAYKLPHDWKVESLNLKWKLYPAMTLALVLLITTGGLGAAADPASPVGFQGWLGLSSGETHLFAALTTLCLNLLIHVWEFTALQRNGELVGSVLARVRQIRQERGLPVE